MSCVSLRLLAEFHALLRKGGLSDPEVDLVLFSSPQRRTTEKYAQLMLEMLVFYKVFAHLADICSLSEFCRRRRVLRRGGLGEWLGRRES